jgi:uncharacterized protein YegP (UPF0339 family)
MESSQSAGRRQIANRRREPAESHFRKLDGLSVSRPGEGRATVASLPCENAGKTPCRFDVYRADEVRMTSTQFSGGDWHWRLSDADGLILLDTGGYASEHECRDAIAILQDNAGWARVAPTS